MKKIIRGAALLLSILFFVSSFCGCGDRVRGIDGIDWLEYDELIASAKSEQDAAVREQMLHRAEDMLMATECVTPLYNYSDAYLSKPELTGVYSTHYGAKYFMYANPGKTTVSAFLGEQPDSFDPALASTASALTVVENTFTGLFAHDASGNVVPALVESYDVSEDGLIYTFRLKPELRWSDGSVLGASDFVFSWRRVSETSTHSPYKYLFDMIAVGEEDKKLMVTADETDTVLTVQLREPCRYFTELCAFPAFYPVNEDCVESAEGYMDIYENVIDPDAWTVRANYVVSGAYTFSGIADGKYVFKQNPYFYNASGMTVDTFEAAFGNDLDTASAYESYVAGGLDYLGTVPPDLHDTLASSADYHTDGVNGVYFLAHNFNCSAFSGMHAEDAASLRRAMSLSIDRGYIIGSVLRNGEKAATSVVPDGTAGNGGVFRRNSPEHTYPNAAECGYFSSDYETNLEEAKKIIKDLGLDADGDGVIDNGHRFAVSYLTTDSASDIAIAQAVQQDLAELGVMVKVSALSEKAFKYEASIHNYDIIALGTVSHYDDALSVLECWTTDAAGNYARLGSVVIKENENAY